MSFDGGGNYVIVDCFTSGCFSSSTLIIAAGGSTFGSGFGSSLAADGSVAVTVSYGASKGG